MAEEEVRVSTSMDRELEDALTRLEQRIAGVELHMGKLRAAAKAAGDGVEEGMDKATRATDKTKRSSEKATPPVRQLGEEMAKTGRKGAVAATGLDRFAKKAEKASKKVGGLGSILSIYKWAGIATGIFALAGGISALGAGAVIALGGLLPMIGVVATVPALFLAAKLSLLAFHLASKVLEPTLTRIKNQFTELGPVIARGGLQSGLNFFANSIGKLAGLTGQGLAGLGGELGNAAREAGRIAKSGPFLDQVRAIFAGMRPIVGNVSMGLLSLARVLLNVVQASLPIVQDMAQDFRDAAEWLRDWSAASLANGKLTEWITHSWHVFTRTIGVLVDVLIGVFNIFRAGAGYASSMGTSVEQAAMQFRIWTDSAEGQARINRYFADSLPALREMGHLVGLLTGGLVHLGANQNVAPLIAQINTELAPAIGHLISSFAGQGGLGPAIISAVAALANLIAGMDFSALTLFAQAIATIAHWIMWISANVPGAHGVIASLLGGFLAFKLLGPAFAVIGSGAKAFSWLREANKMTGELSLAQKLMGGLVLPTMRTLAKVMGGALVSAIKGVGLALRAAFVTSPIGWIVLAIAALIIIVILLWNKCQWFRDAVMAVWNAIKIAFFAVVNALKIAWFATINALRTALNAVVGFFVGIWNAVTTAAKAVWNALVAAWQAVVGVIVAISMWIWDHGLKQVFAVIVVAAKIAFGIIAFVVQTAVYIIMAIVAGLAKLLELLWKVIAAGAVWAFNNVILPVVRALEVAWNATTATLGVAWRFVVNLLATVWNWFYSSVISPVITAITIAWNALTGVATMLWQGFINGIVIAWNWFYQAVLGPAIMAIQILWTLFTGAISAAWSTATGWLGDRWNWFKGIVSGAIDGLRSMWGSFTSWLSGVFKPAGDAIGVIWKGISDAASVAGSIVKGVWNGVLDILKGVWNVIAHVWNAIPSVTVPDWVPAIGGTTFSLPKMPILFSGGPTPGGPALVGEHGPELLLRGGQLSGLLGARGPEIANLPRGGYVLPNLSTMAAGMAKPIPAPVAAAVARSAPAYASAGASHDRALAEAVRELADVVARPPMTVVGGEDTRAAVLDALEEHDRRERARGAYDYTAGQG